MSVAVWSRFCESIHVECSHSSSRTRSRNAKHSNSKFGGYCYTPNVGVECLEFLVRVGGVMASNSGSVALRGFAWPSSVFPGNSAVMP
jgi:hypothetical protein